jgi:hypothetical protein
LVADFLGLQAISTTLGRFAVALEVSSVLSIDSQGLSVKKCLCQNLLVQAQTPNFHLKPQSLLVG